MKAFLFVLKALLFLSLSATNLYAEEEVNIDQDGIILNGYDAVSYFTQSPVKGKTKFSFDYNGATYLFSNEQNLATFSQTPAQFIPQFGGYCSYGVRLGKKFDSEHDAYAVIDDKLYLLLNRATQNVWEIEQSRNIAIAHTLWPSLEGVSAQQLENQ